MHKPDVTGFHDARTGSIQYVVSCPVTRECAIIDPVLDFDEKSGSTATTNADRILRHIGDHDLKPRKSISGFSAADHLATMASTVKAWTTTL